MNIASISGKEGNPGQLAYASSKGGVIAATKTMGKDYAESVLCWLFVHASNSCLVLAGITINSVAPAVIRTAMVDAVPQSQVGMFGCEIYSWRRSLFFF